MAHSLFTALGNELGKNDPYDIILGPTVDSQADLNIDDFGDVEADLKTNDDADFNPNDPVYDGDGFWDGAREARKRDREEAARRQDPRFIEWEKHMQPVMEAERKRWGPADNAPADGGLQPMMPGSGFDGPGLLPKPHLVVS